MVPAPANRTALVDRGEESDRWGDIAAIGAIDKISGAGDFVSGWPRDRRQPARVEQRCVEVAAIDRAEQIVPGRGPDG